MEHGISEPKCKAILLCDNTILEAATGKISLIGVFTSFLVRETPARTHPAEAFLQITDAQGRYELVIEIHDQNEQKIIARAIGPAIEIPDRLAYINVVIPIPQLLIKHVGSYDFVVLANAKEIDRQQFKVIATPDMEN